MRAFAALYEALDSTTGTNAKVQAMANYFRAAAPADAAWALYFLTGRRLKRFISSTRIRAWTEELTHIPDWLFQESYNAVGDSAEVCALLLDALYINPNVVEELPDHTLSQWMEERIRPLVPLEEDDQKAAVQKWWRALSRSEVFILNKLLTGSFRVGVSQSLVSRALAEVSGLEVSEIAHRLMGDWDADPEWYTRLIAPGEKSESNSRPYPFFLASPLEQDVTSLGQPNEWQAERKWDGIRAQLIKRNGEVFLWSRGEELITDRFPEITRAAQDLPDGTVLDGEVLAAKDGVILPFAILQKRIGRKTLGKAILAEAPAILMVYDLLEQDAVDLRPISMGERQAKLEALLEGRSSIFQLSPVVKFETWDQLWKERERSREMNVEGIMLKRMTSPYQSGRRRGDWWKWKIDPLTVDAVLLYAQAGSGRRANLYTDYTFAVWDGEQLVPVAKAYSGLTDEEINKLDHWIRRNTKEKFGPVRSVSPHHVFEIAFEGINASPRHRAGVALRFPRILKWRSDKKIEDADKLDTLKAMVHAPDTANGKSAVTQN